MHLVPLIECAGKGFPDGFYEFKNCDSFKLLKEAREKQFVSYLNIGATWKPWHLYRSTLPFTPMSSPFHKLYGHLSDPVRIFTISGEFTGHRIPLSEDLLNARMVMEAKLHNLPEQVDRQYSSTSQSTASTTSLINIVDPETKDEVQFNDPDFRNGIVTCAALSLDGHHVALGFGSGVVELADIDHQHTISRFQLDPPNHPVWIEFVHGSHRVAAEDSEGNVTILSHDMTAANLGNLPSGPLPAVTRVSDNGLFIIRVPRNTDSSWYDSLTLVSILGDPHLQHLAPPSSNNFTPTSNPPILASEPSTSSSASIKSDAVLTIPHRRTLGFSPGAHYIGAFDGLSAFTWSTSSGELISSYRVTDFNLWIMNPAVPFTCSYRIPDPVSPRPTLSLTEGEAAHTHYSETHAGHNLDSSWIKCPFYVLLPSEEEWDELTMLDIHSSAAGRTPLFGTNGKRQRLPVSFNGKLEFIIPKEYEPVVFSGAKGLGAWYGDRVPFDPTFLYSPRSSKDGTRILLQGWQTAPIVVDLSQVI
ncbi:uncharacterized protein EI90DRAFT_3045287 [Cantharellus anzutake]|uniref:uncharacterized protein n=1 Tax=Cantharellus anzutake TaxID=1750568 RepID=UPI001905EA23|nr:uncharacterized protein EI90DRAFT_3045287 [Cantharellus anzutake]KAF8336319.1 hypothetical protein EI90DRAFT_3045287 [Cantharellus anzutake]